MEPSHQMYLCKGVKPPPNEYLGYNTKQSNGQAPEMLELGEMQSTPSLQSLSGPLWPRVVAPDRVLSMGHLNVCKWMTDVKLLLLHRNIWKHLTMCKQMSTCSFKKCYQQNMFTNHIYLIYMYKEDLAWNNL